MPGKIIIIFIAIFIASINLAAKDLSITYPVSNQKICNDGTKIRVEWNYTGNENIYIRVVFRLIPPFYQLMVADSIPIRQGYAIVGSPYSFIEYRPFDLILRNSVTGEDLAVSSKVTVYNKPVIHNQSVIHQVCKGHPLKLFVLADGDYKSVSWYKNGKLIDGANDITLWLDNPDTGDNGTYKCVLNSYAECGSVESKDMTVVVGDGPDVVEQPQNIPFVKGRDANFRARFHLTPEDDNHVRFRWWRDTTYNYIYYVDTKEITRLDTTIVPIYDGPKFAGTQSDYLSVKMTTVWDKVNYYCEAITDWGCSFTQAARVLDWFDLLTLKNEFTECAGRDAQFVVLPIGIDTNLINYQWYTSKGVVLPEGDKYKGTKTRFLNVLNTQVSDVGDYFCRITDPNTGYFANSEICYINIRQKPIVHETSGDYTVKDRHNKLPGQTNLWVNVSNNNYDPCFFKWYKDGIFVGDSCCNTFRCAFWPFFMDTNCNEDYYRPRSAIISDTGNYVCRIYNTCGETWTDTLRVTWGYDDVTLCIGSDALLKVDKFNGSDDYYYYWTKNGKKLTDNGKFSGTSTYELTVYNCDTAKTGDYYVTAVSKNDGVETYIGSIFLNIYYAPEFTRQPPDTIKQFYDFYSMNKFVMTYKVGFSYQLYYGDTPLFIPTVIGNSNQIEKPQEYSLRLYDIFLPRIMKDTLAEGKYRLKIWNDCGETWSKPFYYIKDKNTVAAGGTNGNSSGDGTASEPNNNKDNHAGDIMNSAKVTPDLRAFPNPANNGTTIDWFGFGEWDQPVVEIYNSFGSKITELSAKGLSEAGAAEFYWDGRDMKGSTVPSGFYFAKVFSRGETKTLGIMICR